MNISIGEYRLRLFTALNGFDPREVSQAVDYYTELLEDAEDTAEQMEKLGTPEQLAQRIIDENGWRSGQGQGFRPNTQNTADTAGSGGHGSQTEKNVLRVLALVLLSPLWITVYALAAALVITIAALYIALPFAAVCAVVSGFYWTGKLFSCSIAMFLLALAAVGLAILLFRPAASGIGGAAELFKRFSGFLFKGGSTPVSLDKKRERRSLNVPLMIAGAVLTVAGLAVSIPMIVSISRDTGRLATALNLETAEQVISDDIGSFELAVKSPGDVKILRSDDGNIRLSAENIHTDCLTVNENNALNVVYESNKRTEFNFNFNFGFSTPSPVIKLYLPDREYEKLNVTASAGDIKINDVKVGDLDIRSNLGDVKMENVEQTGSSFYIKSDLGDIKIAGCNIAAEKERSKIEQNTGDVKLENINTPALDITEQLGDVKIDNSTADIISIHQSCGDVKIKNSRVSEDLHCTSDLGSVKFELIGTDYNVKADTDLGSVKVNGKKLSELQSGGNVPVNCHCSCGDIKIDFA